MERTEIEREIETRAPRRIPITDAIATAYFGIRAHIR
jgi:hypothetical protein